jgi:superfamily II DNA or RNA helicase
MPKVGRKNGGASRGTQTAKYDAHHTVLNSAYGAFADLRRELADSKTAVAERTELLGIFANCTDSQRAWLLLEDYFEKLDLARKDFPGNDWWPRMLAVHGKPRLEETAMLFLRANRPLPSELLPHANLERFAEIEQAEQEQQIVHQLEEWLVPRAQAHLDAPRACLRVLCHIEVSQTEAHLHELKAEFHIFRPRAGEKKRTLGEIFDLRTRAAHEAELFPAADWEMISWIAERYADLPPETEFLRLQGIELLQWLARWGDIGRLELVEPAGTLQFHGEPLDFSEILADQEGHLSLTHTLRLPDGSRAQLSDARFFAGTPRIASIGKTFYLLRKAPPEQLLLKWLPKPFLPVSKLSHRLLTHLRREKAAENNVAWDQLCVTHSAVPQFTFELSDETVRLRLLATSERDKSVWQWNGHEWQRNDSPVKHNGKPDILDDERLEAAAEWLRRLDWFTPEPGLWVGDANELFLNTLAGAWPHRPKEAEYLGNPAFQRLFLAPRKLKPKLLVQGSGIDWFSVSAAWEAEGMKLSPGDLQRLQSATGRFVKLPDSGWLELDVDAVRSAHETFAELGLDGLTPVPQKIDLAQAKELTEDALQKFSEQPFGKSLRERISEFKGIPHFELPQIQAELRPYQKDGFDFLRHLSDLKLGGILADDMGLGKTLQTLSWLESLRIKSGKKSKPALVICPASVLHNWRREANRFTPEMKVLLLESGAARHNLRQQIPEHDLIITNYSLLRRDLAALQKFDFQAIILDEAQYIKNPSAQVTQSVKQLKATQRLALTGTPLENRLLDLWSITDFVQPGYLGSQTNFNETYEPKGEDAELSQKLARKRLSAKLRPIMLRRLKKQVAKDLPDRIEERRDCPLGEDQRKLYLAELRRSREQIMQTVDKQGLAKSKIHVLAALTRLRQICCHPQLVGNDTASGKTETLFELLEPLLAEGQKVLVFSQFVQMLKLLEVECQQRSMPTHILTGETKSRQEVVNAFQNDANAAIFLLSLRAAGTGLNLTTASYVVLYDPWWNPAVEAQAIDRSHRIGQTRTVNAYRLITPGTVEEKIFDLQQRKAQTIADVLGEEGFAKNLTKTDLEYLFAED